MKKIITVIAVIAAFAVAGYICWRYFDKTFKEYTELAELKINSEDEVCFLKDAVVLLGNNGMKAYSLNADGEITEIYSESFSEGSIVFSSENFAAIYVNDTCKIYSSDNESFVFSAELDGELLSAHQFADKLYVKTKNIKTGATVIYAYDTNGKAEELSSKQDFSFVDYCIDELTGNEFFISYEAAGEYIKLVIRIYNNGIQTKRIEMDNVVYNSFDYINGMFVFYTDHSMLFINTDTLVRRSVNCYDINALDKFIYTDKIVYYWKDAYFDGVNNVFIVTKEASSYASFGDRANLCIYNNTLIYSDEKYVKCYDFSASLLNDNVLFNAEAVKALGVVNGTVAVREKDRIAFMKSKD